MGSLAACGTGCSASSPAVDMQTLSAHLVSCPCVEVGPLHASVLSNYDQISILLYPLADQNT